MQTLQEQLDDFPANLTPIILELVESDGSVTEVVVDGNYLSTLPNDERLRLESSAWRFVLYGRNYASFGYAPGQGAAMAASVRVYRVYKEAL